MALNDIGDDGTSLIAGALVILICTTVALLLLEQRN